ncbi:MAG: hypothetical protein OXF84_13885 [Bacteroidetes bacterium]|nr:hypothetical protein [Bacteroidota bacterium]
MESATHYGTVSPMQKQRGLTVKFKRSKPLVEDIESLKISEFLFSSFVAVWVSIHTIDGRTENFRVAIYSLLLWWSGYLSTRYVIEPIT